LHRDDPPVWVYGGPLSAFHLRSPVRASVKLTHLIAQWLVLAMYPLRSYASQVWTDGNLLGPTFTRAALPTWRAELTPVQILEAEDALAIYFDRHCRMSIIARSNRAFDKMSTDELERIRAVRGFADVGKPIQPTENGTSSVFLNEPTQQEELFEDDDFNYSLT
jgi:hypothetical protein